MGTGFNNTIRKITEISGVSVGILAFIMAFIVTYDVILRYIFNAPTSWVVEISNYMMGYIVFIGAAYGLLKGAHVKVDILTSRLQGAPKKILNFIVILINVTFIIVFIWQSFLFWLEAFRQGERSWGSLSIPLAIPYVVFPIGMCLLLIVQFTQVSKLLTVGESQGEIQENKGI